MRDFSAELPEALDGERVDRVVAMLCDLPRRTAAGLVDAGEVRIDGRIIGRRSTRVRTGQSVQLTVPEVAPPPSLTADEGVPVAVVYEDAHLVVVDKAADVVVHPGAGNASGTLVHGLLARYPEIEGVGERDRPGIVHRLDRDTSGLMVVARTDEALDLLQSMIKRRAVTRQYRALVWGHVADQRGLIDAPIGRSPGDPTRMAVVVGGREARTAYEVLDRYREPVEVTELSCTLETGRTHQIRVHAQALGHPVVGDTRYGGARESFPAPRHCLHAERLAFPHPTTGEQLEFTSELPSDLVGIWSQLR